MINVQEKEEDKVNINKMASPRGSIEQLICQLSCGVICGIVCMMVTVTGQDDFGDDAMDMDMDAIMGGEGGKVPGATTAKPVMLPELTYIEQSTRALQQLALVIGIIIYKCKGTISVILRNTPCKDTQFKP